MVLRIRGGTKVVDIYEEHKERKNEEGKVKNYLSLNIPAPKKSNMPDFPDRMSVSRMQSFFKCAFYFKLQYIDGFKVSEDSVYLSRGKELHDMFYYASMTGMPEVIRSFDGYNKYPEHCENFIGLSRTIMNKNGYNVPFMAENEIYDEQDKVIMYLDRIDKVGKSDVCVELVDYKTTMPKTNINEYRFQLAFYTYYIKKVLGLKVKRWGIMFTGGNGDLVYEPVDEKKVNMIPEMLKLVREGIVDCHSSKFEKRRNSLCFNCKFKAFALCDGAPQQKREKYAHGLLDIYRHEWSSEVVGNGEE